MLMAIFGVIIVTIKAIIKTINIKVIIIAIYLFLIFILFWIKTRIGFNTAAMITPITIGRQTCSIMLSPSSK